MQLHIFMGYHLTILLLYFAGFLLMVWTLLNHARLYAPRQMHSVVLIGLLGIYATVCMLMVIYQHPYPKDFQIMEQVQELDPFLRLEL